MPITFACPHCNRNYQVADQMAGQAVKCQACNNAITVPAGQAPATAASIAFSCGSCGKAYQVGPEYAGRQVQCQACKNPVQVPGGSPAQQGHAPQQPAAQQPSAQQQPTAQGSPITFACQSCSKQYTVGPNMAGKQAKCQACQAVMQIPMPGAAAQPSMAPAGAFSGGNSIFDEVTEGDLHRWHGKPEEADNRVSLLPPELGGRGADKHGAGAWRDGDLLVVRNGAKLPDRCIKTNEPATKHVSVKLVYTPAWVMVAWLVCGWIGYAVVSAMVSKSATIEYGVSSGPVKRYWIWVLIGVGAVLFGIFGEGISAMLSNVEGAASIIGLVLAMFFIVLIIAGCIVLAVVNPFVKVKFVNENESHAWIAGVSPAYLAELPDWGQSRPF